MTDSPDVTRMLEALTGGDDEAAAALLPIVYDELRDLARRCLRDEHGLQTLQPTALVHEVYIRLVGNNGQTWENRRQFFAVAAQAMRHLLIDRARRRNAAKRGGDRGRVSLDDVAEPFTDRDDYLVALDDALADLASVDGELCRLVELRFFAGLGVEETASLLGLSTATVKRRWRLAKGWLRREMTRGP